MLKLIGLCSESVEKSHCGRLHCLVFALRIEKSEGVVQCLSLWLLCTPALDVLERVLGLQIISNDQGFLSMT